MRPIQFLVTLCAILVISPPALAAPLRLTYDARVVHNNRSELSNVRGQIELASGEFTEIVDQSFLLDYRQFPAGLHAARPALPTVWGRPGHLAHQFLSGIPRFDSPLLRHFLVGEVIARCDDLAAGQAFLEGQLVLDTVERRGNQVEIIGKFRETPLVIVVRTASEDGATVPTDLAVLGADAELYQYFFDRVTVNGEPLAGLPPVPEFDPAHYVEFPGGQDGMVPIVPVKDWLVFQAQLPNGRPLNLLFDSGTETMIMDDMVLKVDAKLEPTGDLPVAGALDLGRMQLYEGFDFDAGGVQFRHLPVLGTSLTSINIGAEMRIHGIIGNEILQLCRIDLDLAGGQMQISPLGAGDPPPGEQLALTFIEDLPHVEAEVAGTGRALMLVDTGQRSSLSVNLDWLDSYRMSDQLKMNGFLGDITGGLAPRYIVEEMNFSLAGQTYQEKAVDAAWQNTYRYGGVPVVGSIGFPLLTRHFGGITFDYGRRSLYLSHPGENLVFNGRPEAWPSAGQPATRLAQAGAPAVARRDTPDSPAATPAPSAPADPRQPSLSAVYQGVAAAQHLSEQEWNLTDPLTLVRTAVPPASGSSGPVLPADTIVDEDTGEIWQVPQAGAAEPEPTAAEAAADSPATPPEMTPEPALALPAPALELPPLLDAPPAEQPAPAVPEPSLDMQPAPAENAAPPLPPAPAPQLTAELVRGALIGMASALPWAWLRQLVWERLAQATAPATAATPRRQGRELKHGQAKLDFDKIYWSRSQDHGNEPQP